MPLFSPQQMERRTSTPFQDIGHEDSRKIAVPARIAGTSALRVHSMRRSYCDTDRICWERICASPILAAGTPVRRFPRRILWTARQKRFCGSREAAATSAASSGRVSQRYTWTSSWRCGSATAVSKPKTKWWKCIRCALSGTTPSRRRSILRCTPFCRTRISIICIRTGASRWRRPRMAGRKWRNLTGGMATS